MGEFWTAMTPWLLMAVAVPAAVVLGLKLTPSDAWAGRIIRCWADSEGFQLLAIDQARGVEGLLTSNGCKAYRVSVRDRDGSVRQGRARVGRLMLGGEGRNLSIRWDEPR